MTIRRQPKGFANPLKNYVFELHGNGGHDAKRSVLIPCIHHPAGGERRWNNSTIHKPEVATTSRCCGGWRAYCIQLVEHMGRTARFGRKRFVKSGKSGESRCGWAHGSLTNIVDVANRLFSGEVQQLANSCCSFTWQGAHGIHPFWRHTRARPVTSSFVTKRNLASTF